MDLTEHSLGPDPLGLKAEEMRNLGYWVVDRVVAHFEDGGQGPAIKRMAPEELQATLGGDLPENPSDPEECMRLLADVALANMQHGGHPRYFARVPGPASFSGVLGDWLSTGFNAIATSWAGGSGPATIELVTLDWLRSLLGLPEGTEGVFSSGGSLANMTGLAVARTSAGAGVAYLSDQTHASIGRALATLGFPADAVRTLPSDADLRLSAETVATAAAEDRRLDRRPAIVVATAGSVNTGAIDPLHALADLCAEEGLWLHVDGAYGAPAALSEKGRVALAGIERADSVVLDPHKWLFQPYDAGCLFVRHPGALERSFDLNPEYLADTVAADGEVNFRTRSLELTRRARALKLWLTFRIHGVETIRTAISRGISLAEHAQQAIEAHDQLSVVTPARLGIVTFERIGACPGEHAAQVAALAASGHAAVTSTMVRGRSVLRLCTINPRTTREDIDSTLARLAVPPRLE